MPIIHEYSIVIPTLNEETNIKNIISDLKAQTIQPKEIIVIDGKSSDNTQQIVKLMEDVTLYSEKAHIAQQRNTGWKKTHTDIVVFLDADTRCLPTFMETSLREFQVNSLDVACPIYVPITSNRVIKHIYVFFNILFFLGQKILPSGAGSCIFANKKILLEIGGFHNKYVYDDIHFIRKAARIGKFSILHTRIQVSARRFEIYGIWQTFIRYLFLSFCFIFKAYNLSNKVTYPFGTYPKL